MSDAEVDAIWAAWSRGESRCPYCIGEPWEEFVAMCDCFQVERETKRYLKEGSGG